MHTKHLRPQSRAGLGTPGYPGHGHICGGQDAIAAVRLLIDADIVRQPSQQVGLGLDPAQDLLVGDEELDVARGPQVAYPCAAEVADQGDVGDEDGGDEDEDEGRGPGGDVVGADAVSVSGGAGGKEAGRGGGT